MNAAAQPTVDDVYSAIKALYFGNDTTLKEKASRWLEEFQLSIHAWEISDKLLREKRDVESSYFAAQTIRSKIQYAFHELPAGSYSALRESLKQHLRACDGNVSHAIVRQITLALADLYLQIASWKVPVQELISEFNSNVNQTYILLELLTMLVEEVNSRRLRIGDNRRQEIRNEFNQHATLILQFLAETIQRLYENVTIVCHVFKCLAGWLSLPAIPTFDLSKSILLEQLFQILANVESPKNLHDAATECVAQTLYLIDDSRNHNELAPILFENVHALRPAFLVCLNKDDTEKLQNYCRIFTELGESLLPTILDRPEDSCGSSQTIELLLDCMNHYDYSLAEMTFNVWYRLSEFVYQRDTAELTKRFEPYVASMLQHLCRHVQCEPDSAGTSVDNEELTEFRSKVSEIVKDVVFIVGSSEFFKRMYCVLKTKHFSTNWVEVEVALFMMSIIARIVMPEDDTIITDLLDNLTHLPDHTHIAITYSAMNLVSQLTHWFAFHLNFLENAVHFFVKCLKNPKLSLMAADSLEALCSSLDLSHAMKDHLGLLLHICGNLDSSFSMLSNDAALHLLRALSILLCDESGDRLSNTLRDLCLKQTQPLLQLLNDSSNVAHVNGSNKENMSPNGPIIFLDRLTAVFRNLVPNNKNDNGKSPLCASVFSELLPVILNTCEKYQTNARVVEHCCKTIRFMIRCMGNKILPFLAPLVEKIFSIYQRHPHSCFLYMGSILVDEYGGQPEFVPGLIQMLKAFVGTAFKYLEQPGAMQWAPDSVDDLFRLCLRFVQKAPDAFFVCEVCEPMFQCASAAVAVDHMEACQSVLKFLCECVDFACNCRYRELNTDFSRSAHDIIKKFGAILVNTCLHTVALAFATYNVKDIADLFWSLHKFDSEAFSKWLEKSLDNLPQKASLTATPEQLMEFYNSVITAKDGKQIGTLLRQLSRLYR